MKKIYSPFTVPLVPYCNNTHVVLYDILADIAKGFAIKCFILETILCKSIFRIFAVCILYIPLQGSMYFYETLQ